MSLVDTTADYSHLLTFLRLSYVHITFGRRYAFLPFAWKLATCRLALICEAGQLGSDRWLGGGERLAFC